MTEQLRHSGIEGLGEIAWGSHFCQFYETKQDMQELLVPYFKAGLENNEFCHKAKGATDNPGGAGNKTAKIAVK